MFYLQLTGERIRLPQDTQDTPYPVILTSDFSILSLCCLGVWHLIADLKDDDGADNTENNADDYNKMTKQVAVLNPFKVIATFLPPDQIHPVNNCIHCVQGTFCKLEWQPA